MQETYPWFTPPTSALSNTSNAESNYFYNYNNHYDYNGLSGPYGSNYSYSRMNSMRTSGENSRFYADQSPVHCPPMVYKQEDMNMGSSNRQSLEHSGSVPTMRHCAQSSYENDHHKQQDIKPSIKPSNDSDTDNFSSVFTKSLTSLYSQDVEGGFVEEKSFDLCDLNSKEENQRVENANSNGYTFPSTFETQSSRFPNDAAADADKNCSRVFPNVPDNNGYGNFKLKTENYSRGSSYRYDGFSYDDMHLNKRENRVENFGRKRKRSVPEVPFNNNYYEMQDKTKDRNSFTSSRNSISWNPSFVPPTNENQNLLNGNYQHPESFPVAATEFDSKGDFQKIGETARGDNKPNRYRSPRGRNAKFVGNRPEKCDEKYPKKPPKKISPLSVYAKIQNDFIVEVKCRRFKKRTKVCESSGNSHNCETNWPYENVCDIVSIVLRNVVDRVTASIEQKDFEDLTSLTPSKTRDLFFKFCQDYSLDFNDFKNFNEIISTDVVCDKRDKKEIVERKRKNQRTMCLEKPLPVISKEIKPDLKKCRMKKHPGGVIERRVLRSLPSRQPRRLTRRTADKNSLFRARYPKRKLRSKVNEQRTAKRLKIVIDITKENESESSQGPPPLKAATRKRTNDDTSNSDSLLIESSRNSRLRKKSIMEKDTKKSVDTEVESVITVSDDDDDGASRDSNETTPANLSAASDDGKESVSKDKKEETTTLGEPPELVRMTDNKVLQFKDNVNETEKRNDKTQSFPSEQEKSPGPPSLNESATILHSESDDSEGELVIDMDAKEPSDRPNSPLPVLTEAKTKTPDTTSTSQEITTNEKQHSSDDECIIIPPEKEKEPLNEATNTLDSLSTTTPFFEDQQTDALDLHKERPVEKDEQETENLEQNEADKQNGVSLLKNKDDGDESILRTLLLESGETISNAGSLDGQDLSNSPLTKLTNLGFKSLSPSTTDSAKPQLSPFRHSPSVYAEEGSSLGKISESIKIPKYQAFHDNYQCALSPTEFSDIEKRFNTLPKSSSQVNSQQSGDSNDKEPWMKDPQQLKEKIKKLKNEVVYLQLMAEQKEKEKTAIICFKRYKEEILKRIYKAYAFTVQDHVRDWIYSRREGNSGSEKRNEDSRSFSDSVQKSTFRQSKDSKERLLESIKNHSDNILDFREDSAYSSAATAYLRNSSTLYSTAPRKPPSVTEQQSSSNRKSPQQLGEKLPAVEAMVAKATENYGVDMRNLREGLRCSPETSTSGTILQKVLSSKEANSNSSPDYFHSPSWSPETNRLGKSSLTPKAYSEQCIPLDMYLSHTSHRNSNGDSRLTKTSDIYRNSPENFSRASYSQNSKEKSRIQTLLSEPIRPKVAPNPFRPSWSIQSGGRITEPGSDLTKNSSASSTNRQPTSENIVGSQSFPLHGTSSSSSKLAPNYVGKNPAPIQDYKTRCIDENVPTNYSRKASEERHSMGYSSMLPSTSSNSGTAMPYGGHLVRNDRGPCAPAAPPAPPAAKSSSGSNASTPLCMGCGLSDAKFLCSGCRKHWYCSPQCQSLRWPEHSRVCGGQGFSQPPGSFS